MKSRNRVLTERQVRGSIPYVSPENAQPFTASSGQKSDQRGVCLCGMAGKIEFLARRGEGSTWKARKNPRGGIEVEIKEAETR